MHKSALLVLALVPCFAFSSDQSPYAGQEFRAVKSLSQQEIRALRRGDGMGFAKVAELNHFPGPRHVLDSAEELDLTPAQLTGTQSLYEEMRRDAVALGNKIIAAESRLNREFEQASISPESLETALLEIGRLRAELRYVHLRAHLSQRRLLERGQVKLYDAIRGYRAAENDHSEHHHMRD